MTERQRATFAVLAETLVPAAEGMPTVQDVALAQQGLDRVLVACPELEQPLAATLDRLDGLDGKQSLAALGSRPDELELALFAVVGAYVTSPAVTSRLGYRGRVATPLVDDVDDEVVALLEGVLARGPRYRRVEADRPSVVEHG